EDSRDGVTLGKNAPEQAPDRRRSNIDRSDDGPLGCRDIEASKEKRRRTDPAPCRFVLDKWRSVASHDRAAADIEQIVDTDLYGMAAGDVMVPAEAAPERYGRGTASRLRVVQADEHILAFDGPVGSKRIFDTATDGPGCANLLARSRDGVAVQL